MPFQPDAVKYMRPMLFWDVTQSMVVISYRRFGGQLIGPIFKRQEIQE